MSISKMPFPIEKFQESLASYRVMYRKENKLMNKIKLHVLM